MCAKENLTNIVSGRNFPVQDILPCQFKSSGHYFTKKHRRNTWNIGPTTRNSDYDYLTARKTPMSFQDSVQGLIWQSTDGLQDLTPEWFNFQGTKLA